MKELELKILNTIYHMTVSDLVMYANHYVVDYDKFMSLFDPILDEGIGEARVNQLLSIVDLAKIAAEIAHSEYHNIGADLLHVISEVEPGLIDIDQLEKVYEERGEDYVRQLVAYASFITSLKKDLINRMTIE